AGNDRRHRLGAFRRLVDVAGDVAGGGVLLLHGGRDGGRDLVDLVDGPADAVDGGDHLAGAALNGVDLAGDLFRRLGGLHGQVLHLGGDHREAAAGVAGARRLDGGVQREQVGLLGDRRDELHHLAVAVGGGGGSLGVAGARPPLFRGALGDAGGGAPLLADLADRGGELLRRARDRLHVVGGLVGRARHHGRLAARLVGGRAHGGG